MISNYGSVSISEGLGTSCQVDTIKCFTAQ